MYPHLIIQILLNANFHQWKAKKDSFYGLSKLPNSHTIELKAELLNSASALQNQ